MSSITKTIRLTGSSSTSMEDSIRVVLARAAVTITDIQRYEVVRVGGSVDAAGVPASFEVTLDITFVVKEAIPG